MFYLNEKGEYDTWGIYCALAVASILNILDDKIKSSVGDYISSLQTYEGGIGP